MSDLSTKRMLAAYLEQSGQKAGFFTSFFQTPERNFHTSAEVTLDIVRSGAHIAPVLTDLSAGFNRSENRKAVNKSFKPAIYGETFGLNSFDAMKRPIGQDPFQDVGFLRAIQEAFTSEMTLREEMIRRGIELQCAQVLRTGVLTLPGPTGATQFTLDYQPKSTHAMVAPTADWDETSGTKRLDDVRGICNVVADDSGYTPKYLIMGELARESFFKDSEVQNQIRKDGTGIGEQVPPQLRNGGSYHGRVSVGQYVLEVWSSTKHYLSLTDGTPQKYLGDWEVLVVGENPRLDLTFGAIPRIAPPDPRLSALSIGRISSGDAKIDLTTNAWFSPDGNQVMGSVGSRPLAIPTAIDSFASLNAKVT